MTISILLADDHQVVREGLRVLLESEEDFQVVGEAADGRMTVQMAEEMQPDVVVLDLMMPTLGGLEATRQIARACPNTKIVVLSMHSDEAYVLEALKNGAWGYVLKSSPGDDLILAVRTVWAGERYLGPPLTARAIDAYASQIREIDPYDALTDREREVLHLSAEGLTSSEIADQLSLSHRTVESHRASVMSKLNLRSKTDLIRYAFKHGIIPLED
ncbi:MAG: response regulator transcription factor [Chloroflexi bacterium]|nr:response regulator transcription factor [Chloroflexota bacterium]